MTNADYNIHGVRKKIWTEGQNYFAEAYSWPPGAETPCYMVFAWNQITGERFVTQMDNLQPPITETLIEQAREIMVKILKAAILGREVEGVGPGNGDDNSKVPIVLTTEGHA
jgi:hypothetical protein